MLFNLYQVPFTDPTGTVQNSEYQIVKAEYLRLTSEHQGQNISEFGLVGDFIGGQPVTLENHCFKSLMRTDHNGRFVYHITLKVDGTRYFMFRVGPGPYNGFIYFINRSLAIYKFLDPGMNSLVPAQESLGLKGFLLDGELIYEPPVRQGTNTLGKFYYLAFDILYHNGLSVIPMDYYTRNGLLNEFVNGYLQGRFNGTNITYSVKQWFNISHILSPGNVYSYIQKETSKLSGITHKADGLILQSFDGPYVTGPWNKYNNIQFKWKPLSEQTMDFRIKVTKEPGQVLVWKLLQKNGQEFKIPGTGKKGTKYTASESTDTAICIPTPSNSRQFSDGDVAEFKWSGSGNRFVLLRAREYGKEPNSLGSIMSIWNFIQDPFTLDSLKPTFKVLTEGNITKPGLKKLLDNYSRSDLVLCILGSGRNGYFFNDSETKKLKQIYDRYIKIEHELEFRLTKTQSNAFNFEYLFGYLSRNYQWSFARTFDVLKNEQVGTYRSTYLSEHDIRLGTPAKNQIKKELSSIKINNPGKGLYGNFNIKIALSSEQSTKTVVPLLIPGKKVNNQIRMKERWSFKMPTMGFIIDLTRVKTGYSLESLAEQRYTYEIEGELTGTEFTFDEFVSNLNKVYIELVKNVNYC